MKLPQGFHERLELGSTSSSSPDSVSYLFLTSASLACESAEAPAALYFGQLLRSHEKPEKPRHVHKLCPNSAFALALATLARPASGASERES